MQNVVGALIVAALLVVAVVYFRDHGRDIVEKSMVSPWILIALGVGESALLVVRGLLTRELCRPFGVNLTRREATALSAWTTLANYITPLVGGMGLRGVYLRHRHTLPYSSFVSLQAATYSLNFLISALLGLLALFCLPSLGGGQKEILTIFFASTATAMIVIHLLPVPGGSDSGGRVRRALRRVMEGWHRLRDASRARVTVILGVNAVLRTATLYAAFLLFGEALDIWQSLLIAVLASFAILIRLTPGSLGIMEGVIIYGGSLVGVALPQAVAAATFLRIASLAVTFVAGLLTYPIIRASKPANS